MNNELTLIVVHNNDNRVSYKSKIFNYVNVKEILLTLMRKLENGKL